jgi:hypothetical protein
MSFLLPIAYPNPEVNAEVNFNFLKSIWSENEGRRQAPDSQYISKSVSSRGNFVKRKFLLTQEEFNLR